MGLGFPPGLPAGGMPGFPLMGPPAALPCLVKEQWADSSMSPGVLYSSDLTKGKVLQVVTVSSVGQIDGSALFVIISDYPADASGKYMEVNFGGSSSPIYSVLLGQAFPHDARAGQSPGLLHLCSAPLGSCTASVAGRQVFHTHSFRLRSLKQVSEPWAYDLVALGAVDEDQPVEAPVVSQPAEGFLGLAESLFGKDPSAGRDRRRKKKHSSSSGSSDEE